MSLGGNVEGVRAASTHHEGVRCSEDRLKRVPHVTTTRNDTQRHTKMATKDSDLVRNRGLREGEEQRGETGVSELLFK